MPRIGGFMAIDHRAAKLLAEKTEAAERFDSPSWPPPEPLELPQCSAPYPSEALPDLVRGAVEEVQGFVKAPTPLVAASALGAVSIAVQGQFNVKRAERLTGPTSLYFLSIADSGERKSSCDGYFTQSIRDFEQSQRDSLKSLQREYAAKLKVFEARESGLKDRLRKLSCDGKSVSDVQNRLFELQDEKPTPPKIPRLIYADATPEALAQGLRHWPSAGVISAEAGVFFGAHGMNPDNAMRNLTQLNAFWDGGGVTIDRKTTESIMLDTVRLSVGLQVQGVTLAEFQRRHGVLARGSGFWARFLFAAPVSTQGSRFFTDPPPQWLRLEAFHRRLSNILHQPLPFGDNGTLHPQELCLGVAAKSAWIDFYNSIERLLVDGGELDDVRDFASKTADNAARIAANFHVFESHSGDINEDTMRRGCAIAVWHLKEAQRFFDTAVVSSALNDAIRLDNWLLDYCRSKRCLQITERQLMQYGPNSLRQRTRLQASMSELTERNRTRYNGKVIEINPALLPPPSEVY
jgi:putative DNA primase/helicase